MDCRDRRPDRYDANYAKTDLVRRVSSLINGYTDLSMGKSMQVTASLNVLVFDNHITVSATRSSGHYVLIEGKRNEDDEEYQIDNCTDSSHCLRTNFINALFDFCGR